MVAGEQLRARWDAGEPVFGLWAGIASSLTAELAATAGYDYVCVDQQHGMSDEPTMVAMFQATAAAGSTPLARVAWNEPWLIMRALDLGAAGVIVPLVGSGAEAARAVQACKFPPHGNRSYGPIRAELVVASAAPDDLANRVLCFAMVETRDGLDRLEEIAATPGLDGIYIGPADLALALGLTPGVQGSEPLEEAIARVCDTCRAHGLIAGMHCGSGREAQARAAAGFRLITVGVDSSWFRKKVQAELTEARSRAAGP
ncbi:MAG TPA: aldolase/citrate lyase family protein [Solirubrobacteraceae bacterium]|nr:aldolase/citrate lyase family protein [Solirubrobacteraceae bacterium]